MSTPATNLIGKLVDRAARLTEEGSFSERNPALGKMMRCPFCKRRRRRNLKDCCTAVEYHPTKVGQIIQMRDGQKYQADVHGAWRKV